MSAVLLREQKSKDYPFKYKCVGGDLETLEEVVGSRTYLWDTREIVTVKSSAMKKVGSGNEKR